MAVTYRFPNIVSCATNTYFLTVMFIQNYLVEWQLCLLGQREALENPSTNTIAVLGSYRSQNSLKAEEVAHGTLGKMSNSIWTS